MKMFGTNGIRGIANEFLDCNRCMKIGQAIAVILGKGPIAIAMDTRVSSDMIRSAVSAGIMSMGCSIHDLGMVPTPALQYYVKTHDGITGGVMITASHNPPEFNGIKCISSDGTECSPEEEKGIEDEFDKELKTVPWNEIGSEINITDAGERYVDAIVSRADVELIRKAKLSVCIDCSNGAACYTTPMLLERLGVKVTALNAVPDGMFPGHYSEPVKENLTELISKTPAVKADLGAAHDGDADRCVFVTSSGRYLPGDVSLALLSKNAVMTSEGSKKVVTTVAVSSMVSDAVKEAGGSVELTAVGSPKVARRMMDCGGIIGGEDNGGIIIAEHQYCRDGAMAIVRMLESIARNGPLDDQVDRLPKYTTIKHVLACKDEFKEKMLRGLAEKHKDDDLNTTDGIRIDYSDGWAIMRPSGTEPKFRITAESKDPAVAKRYADTLKKEYDQLYSKMQ